METVKKNWKTTLGGLVVLGVLVAQNQGFISSEVASAINNLAIAFGLIVASDGSVVSQLAGLFSKDDKY